jgi:hypothetical protein
MGEKCFYFGRPLWMMPLIVMSAMSAANQTPVAKHGVSITDLHHFFKAVGDENNTQALHLSSRAMRKSLSTRLRRGPGLVHP